MKTFVVLCSKNINWFSPSCSPQRFFSEIRLWEKINLGSSLLGQPVTLKYLPIRQLGSMKTHGQTFTNKYMECQQLCLPSKESINTSLKSLNNSKISLIAVMLMKNLYLSTGIKNLTISKRLSSWKLYVLTKSFPLFRTGSQSKWVSALSFPLLLT